LAGPLIRVVRSKRWRGLAVRIALIIAAGLLISAGCSLGPPEVVTDITRYGSLRGSWSGLADHFPREVPESTTLARLSYFPGFMQGGAWLQLRLTLPAGEVASIESEYAPRAIRTYERGGDANRHANQPDGVPTTFYRTGAEDSSAFPTSFTVYVLKADDHGGHWNHGESAGLAISREANEVVYWADHW
jgi:hypothetical protein